MDISISEAKAKLSEYVEKARQGQEITLHKNNVPVCKLVKIEATTNKQFGLLRGKAVIPDDFDHYDQEIIDMFYGPNSE